MPHHGTTAVANAASARSSAAGSCTVHQPEPQLVLDPGDGEVAGVGEQQVERVVEGAGPRGDLADQVDVEQEAPERRRGRDAVGVQVLHLHPTGGEVAVSRGGHDETVVAVRPRVHGGQHGTLLTAGALGG